MATIQIRGVSDETYEVLVRRAEKAGQSLRKYVFAQLADLASSWARGTRAEDGRHSRGAGRCKALTPCVIDASVLASAMAETTPLVEAAFSLRENISVNDALYVALASRLEVPLVAGDRKLARAPGLPCEVHLV